MVTAHYVREVSAATRFRPEIAEKVIRLCGILEHLENDQATKGQWVLKGGTALNIVHLDVPRMSVDIDINYIGAVDVVEMRNIRPNFERALISIFEREGCTVCTKMELLRQVYCIKIQTFKI
jgi:predicted nucleotidyltransferase component of viral defense system